MTFLRFISPFLVAVTLVAFLFSRISFETFPTIWANVSMVWVFLAVCVLALGHALSIIRWRYLLFAVGVQLPVIEATKIYFGNLIIAKWTPAYSGDFLRAVYLKHRLPTTEGAAIIMIESLIDVFTLFSFVTFGALVMRDWFFLVIGILGILFLGCVFLFFRSALIEHLPFAQTFAVRWRIIFRSPVGSPRVLFVALLCSIFIWLQTVFFVQLLFLAFGESLISFFHILTVQPIITLFALLPVTLGGLGTREAAMLFFYSPMVAAPLVFMVALVYSFVSLILFPLVGVLFTFGRIKSAINNEEQR